MYILELTNRQASALTKVVANKLKEIHAWRIACKSNIRDKEYDDLVGVIKAATYRKDD